MFLVITALCLTSCLCVQAGEQVQLLQSTKEPGDAALRERAPATFHQYMKQKQVSVEVSCRLFVQPWSAAAHSNASADAPQHKVASTTWAIIECCCTTAALHSASRL